MPISAKYEYAKYKMLLVDDQEKSFVDENKLVSSWKSVKALGMKINPVNPWKMSLRSPLIENAALLPIMDWGR